MTIRHVLLASVSACTICAGAAFGKSTPDVLVAQMHAGHAVVKTVVHSLDPANITSSASVDTSVTKSDYKKKTKLADTYYTFLHSGTFCTPPKEHVKLSVHKTKYAKLFTGTETESEGCSSPTKFYGDVYDLQTKKKLKKADTFTSSLIGKDIHFDGTVYKKGTLNLKVSVTVTD